MRRRLAVRPSNSIVFVHGGGQIEVATEKINPRIGLVAASPSCLAVGCNPVVDGPTELTFGHSTEVDPGYAPGFVGQVETPRRRIIVDTVDEEVIFDQIVPSTQTALRIWFSHPKWPEQVIIGIDQDS